LGNKLCFRTIKPVGHDSNHNPIRQEINILSFGETHPVKKPKIKVKSDTGHNEHMKKIGNLLKMFLDDEVQIPGKGPTQNRFKVSR